MEIFFQNKYQLKFINIFVKFSADVKNTVEMRDIKIGSSNLNLESV